MLFRHEDELWIPPFFNIFTQKIPTSMNYHAVKDDTVSELIDPANITGASFGFCLMSDCVPQPDIIIYNHKPIRYHCVDSSI
jgi:hypothetical protein